MSTARLLPSQPHRIGTGFQAEGWREPLALLDPFLMVDHFRMRDAVFAPHPHAGFSALTYLFDDSDTGMVSRDSLGGEHLIRPGALHWTQAGRGVMHDEFPAEPGREVHGLQIFLNLPADQKLCAPAVMQIAPEQMPRREGPGWQAQQVFGPGMGLALPWPASLVLVDIAADAEFDLALADGEQGLVTVIHGSGLAHALPLAADQALALPVAGSSRIRAVAALRLACFSGRPLFEPVVRHGPFAMSDEGQVVAALQRFHSGGMGRLSPRTNNTSHKEIPS